MGRRPERLNALHLILTYHEPTCSLNSLTVAKRYNGYPDIQWVPRFLDPWIENVDDYIKPFMYGHNAARSIALTYSSTFAASGFVVKHMPYHHFVPYCASLWGDAFLMRYFESTDPAKIPSCLR